MGCTNAQSVPLNVLEEYDMTSMTLEYRRECRQSNLLESLTSTTASLAHCNNSINRRPDLEYTHLLRMQADKAEIVRARTEWHGKQKHKSHWWIPIQSLQINFHPHPSTQSFLIFWFSSFLNCFLIWVSFDHYSFTTRVVLNFIHQAVLHFESALHVWQCIA